MQPAAGDAGQQSVNMQQALMLLARKWDRMDVPAAMARLPGDLPMAAMAECLGAMGRGMTWRHHSATLQARRVPLNAQLPQLAARS